LNKLLAMPPREAIATGMGIRQETVDWLKGRWDKFTVLIRGIHLRGGAAVEVRDPQTGEV
jgi:hypothetical protein